MIDSPGRRGFTMLEIMIAVTILAICFIPVLENSRAVVSETEESQENLLARHYLSDMVERFRDSNLDELNQLPATEPTVALGATQTFLKNDAVLSDRDRVLTSLKALAAAGTTDGGLKGVQQFEDIQAQMKMTSEAWFQPAPVPTLNCVVRWQMKAGAPEKRIQFSKVMTGAASFANAGSGCN